MKRKKQRKHILFIVFIVFIIMFFVFDEVDEKTTLKIEKGLSTPQIADVLKENKVIKSKTVFLVMTTLSEYRGKLKYGDFTFEEGDGYYDIIKK